MIRRTKGNVLNSKLESNCNFSMWDRNYEWMKQKYFVTYKCNDVLNTSFHILNSNLCHLKTKGLSTNCRRTCTQSTAEWSAARNWKRHWERLSIRLPTGSNPSQLWTPSRVSEKIQMDKPRPSLILKSLQRKSRLSLSSWSNSGISTRTRVRKIASAPGT